MVLQQAAIPIQVGAGNLAGGRTEGMVDWDDPNGCWEAREQENWGNLR